MRIETPEHLNADNYASRLTREWETFLMIAPSLSRADFEKLSVRNPRVWEKYRAEFDSILLELGR